MKDWAIILEVVSRRAAEGPPDHIRGRKVIKSLIAWTEEQRKAGVPMGTLIMAIAMLLHSLCKEDEENG